MVTMNGDNDNGDISVPILKYTCPDQLLSELCTTRSPVVLRNVPMGKCSSWSPDYLMEKLSGIKSSMEVENVNPTSLAPLVHPETSK